MELNDTLVEYNSSSNGSSKTSAYDGGCVILLDSAATFEAVDCDCDKSNSPDDVFSSEGDSHEFGTGVSFTCSSDCE